MMDNESYEQQETPYFRRQSEHRSDQAADTASRGIPSLLSTFGLGNAFHFADTQETISALSNQAWPVRVAAVRALCKMGQNAPVEALLSALGDEHEAVRAAVARHVYVLGEHAPVHALVAALQDTSWHVRSACVMTLGKLREQVPIVPLMMALHDEDEAVRAAAVWALNQHKEHLSLDVLLQAVRDPAWSVREATALAAGETGQTAAIEPLLAASQDEDITVRRTAEQALQNCYPDLMALYAASTGSTADTDPADTADGTDIADVLDMSGIMDMTDMANMLDTADTRRITGALEHEITPLQQQTVHEIAADTAQLVQTNAPQRTHIFARGFAALAQNAEAEKGWHAAKTLLFPESQTSSSRPTPLRKRTKKIRQTPTARSGLRSLASLAEGGLIAAVLIGIMLATWFAVHQRQPQTAGYEQPIIFNSHTRVKEIAWSEDQQRLLLADSTGGLQIWDMNSKQLTRVPGDFSQTLTTIWQDSNLYVATLATNGTRGEITIEQVNEELAVRPVGYFPATIPTTGQPPVAAFWSDGQNVRLAIGSADGRVQVYDVSAHTPIQSFATDTKDDLGNTVKGYVTALAWTHNGTRLATAIDDGTRVANNIYLQEWDATTGMAIGRSNRDVSVKVVTMAWSPNADYLALGSSDGNIGLWYPAGAKESAITNTFSATHQPFSPTLAWSQDGTRFAATTASGGVQIWDTSGNQLHYYPAYAQINDVTWSPNGKYLAWANADGTIQVQPAP